MPQRGVLASARWHADCTTSGMLAWAVLFFVLSIVVAILGGAAVAAGTAVLAEVVFYTLITVVALGLLGALLGSSMT